jgi:hypothetical protein
MTMVIFLLVMGVVLIAFEAAELGGAVLVTAIALAYWISPAAPKQQEWHPPAAMDHVRYAPSSSRCAAK